MQTESQAPVIAFLSQGAEQVIRTHASIVFLRGDRALKLKQAVRYSYLDYGTVALRRAACEAELATNRRAAPELYLAVEPVTRAADGGLALDGEGEPVDWLVVMRRFPDDALFDRMAERGTLTPALIASLAEAILAFHAEAAPTPAFGGSAAMRQLIDDSIVNLTEGGLPPPAIAALESALDAALGRCGALLDRRRAAGRVRHCHGDLHLGNICLYDGRPMLFDAIEFSPAIAHIDVLYDLAFVLMDLWHRQLPHFANALFNHYLDAGADADGLAAMPLFLALRAAIRALVSAAAGKPEPAQQYLDLAQALLQPSPPRLVAVGGLSGSGKSTLAAALAPALGVAPGARLLRSDVIRKRLLGVAPTTRLGSAGYTDAVSVRVFATLEGDAAAALAAGYSVVLDSVAARPEQRAAFAQVAARAGVPFTGLWLDAPAATMAARIGARTADASDATVDVLRAQLSYQLGAVDWHRLDAGGGPDTVLAAAQQMLSG